MVRMRLAESVTFGGGGLDRVAALRAKTEDVAALLSGPQARVLPVWRGKPLLAPGKAGWVPPGHPVLSGAAGPPVLLGQAEGLTFFAQDISAWDPGEGNGPARTFFDPTEQQHPSCPADHRFVELRGVMTALPALDAELCATAKAILGWQSSHRFCAACGQPSQVTHSGWQRSCGACGAQHFPRTDPVVIMLVTRGNKVLLGRSPGWPEGMYSLLAGFMEPGETVEAAVRREVAEESGIRVGAVRYLASQPWPYPASLMIGCTGEALNDEIVRDPAELEAARWVSREDLARVFAGEHAEIRAPRAGAIAGFLLANWLADRLD
jgi:NAD+ diphosphatase